MNANAISLSGTVRPANDPLVIGLITLDAQTGALSADRGFRRFCHGADAASELASLSDLLTVVLPADRLAFGGRLLSDASTSRNLDITCRIVGALGEPVMVRFLRSHDPDPDTANRCANYIAVTIPEPVSTASPMERVALLLIEAEGLARQHGSGLLSKLIRAVLLQVGFEAGADLAAERLPRRGEARH